MEEKASIVVACVPTLGPFVDSIGDNIRTLQSRRHHTQIKEPFPSRKELPIPLRPVVVPPMPAVHYHSSAEPTGNPFEGLHGDRSNFGSGIQKTIKVEVGRSDDFVWKDELVLITR